MAIDLPIDLIDVILGQVWQFDPTSRIHTLHSLALVNRSWSAYATPALYRHPHRGPPQ